MNNAMKRILEAVVIAAASAVATWGVEEVRQVVAEKRQADTPVDGEKKVKKGKKKGT